ncbi:glycoside hydrolase family 32 protein [Actinoplanes sp. NPDC051861]|uniref:glycoside hydrolase family 32 protein n=1 Tax=Actinoplanes sp. NPDC051861 TaxID=3155170 RepID=UPI00344128E9
MEPAPRVPGLRPRVHFAPRTGRVGDVFGVLPVGGQYHVFYEHRPDPPVADGVSGWGYAVSEDLVLWTEQGVVPPALEPRCGTVVAGPSGPMIFSARAGQVRRAVAGADLAGWHVEPVALLPSAAEARDPFVWWTGDEWRMLVAAGGDVLQYHSADLVTWEHDGILISVSGDWGCPRFFALDGSWVLIVSTGTGLAYAIGDYDGREFTARARGVFGRGHLGPAATFADAAGRRCVLARLGEEAAPPGSAWAGTLSLPWILTVRGDRLIATPHPHLDRYLINGATGLSASGGEVRDNGEVILRMPAGGETLVLADADIVEVIVEGVSGLGVARRVATGPAGVRVARFGSR